MTILSRTALPDRFFHQNGSTYDQIAKFSTLGLDDWWKRKVIDKVPKNPARILDQACGTGILTFKMAKRFPQCRITGVDLQEGYLDIAREKARDLGFTNIEFIQGRAEEVVVEGPLDCITSCYLAKYVDLDILVAKARAMLRDGGVLVMHELTRPATPIFSGLWKAHFKFLQIYGKWKHPEWEVAFRELPVLLNETKWVDELTRALKANNFSDIRVDRLAFDASAIVSARK